MSVWQFPQGKLSLWLDLVDTAKQLSFRSCKGSIPLLLDRSFSTRLPSRTSRASCTGDPSQSSPRTRWSFLESSDTTFFWDWTWKRRTWCTQLRMQTFWSSWTLSKTSLTLPADRTEWSCRGDRNRELSLPGPWFKSRRCWSWTKRLLLWTPSRRRICRRLWASARATGPSSSSLTACSPSATPTSLRTSKMRKSPNPEPTPNSWRRTMDSTVHWSRSRGESECHNEFFSPFFDLNELTKKRRKKQCFDGLIIQFLPSLKQFLWLLIFGNVAVSLKFFENSNGKKLAPDKSFTKNPEKTSTLMPFTPKKLGQQKGKYQITGWWMLYLFALELLFMFTFFNTIV